MKTNVIFVIVLSLLLFGCNEEEDLYLDATDEAPAMIHERELEDGSTTFGVSYEELANLPEDHEFIIDSNDETGEVVVVELPETEPGYHGGIPTTPLFGACDGEDIFSDPDRPVFPYDDGQCRFIIKWCGPDQFCDCSEIEMTAYLSYNLSPANSFWSQTQNLTPGSWAVFDLQSAGNLIVSFKCLNGGNPSCKYSFYVDKHGFNKGASYNLQPSTNSQPRYGALLSGQYYPHEGNGPDTWWYCNPFCTLEVPYYQSENCQAPSRYLKLYHSQSGSLQSYMPISTVGWGLGYLSPLEPRANVLYHLETANIVCPPNEFCYDLCYSDFQQQIGICPSNNLTIGSKPYIMSTGSSPGVCTGFTEVSRNLSCQN
jgi:hypothetical protein